MNPLSDPASAPPGDAEYVHEGTLRGYLIGFALAAMLTVVAFWLVMGHVLTSDMLTIFVVLGLAVAQMLVHVVFFLHLDTRSQDGWNMLAAIFSVVLVIIVLGASTWVLVVENQMMMPGLMHEDLQQTMPQ